MSTRATLIAAGTMALFMMSMAIPTRSDASGDGSSRPFGHFPDVKAANLEKRELSLPSDFAGARNLLLLAFAREQQRNVETWLREMKRFEPLDPGFRYYELPTIERPNALTRWFIDSGMRRGIPDQKARERTITLYLDKKPFCDALGITDQKTIYALLVDRAGNVLWRSEGDFDEKKGASLKSALESLARN